MQEKVGQPRSFKDFRKQSEQILQRLAQQCIQYETRPIRLQQTREILDFIQGLVKFAESRNDAADNLREEKARLKAQVVALQAVLTPIVAASKGITENATAAPQSPEDEDATREAR